MNITLTIEMAENGYVLTRRDNKLGMTETYVFDTYAKLLTAVTNMTGVFERR